MTAFPFHRKLSQSSAVIKTISFSVKDVALDRQTICKCLCVLCANALCLEGGDEVSTPKLSAGREQVLGKLNPMRWKSQQSSLVMPAARTEQLAPRTVLGCLNDQISAWLSITTTCQISGLTNLPSIISGRYKYWDFSMYWETYKNP